MATRLKWVKDDGGGHTAKTSLCSGYTITRRGRWYSLQSWSYPGCLVRSMGTYGSLLNAKRAAGRDNGKWGC